MNDLSRYARQTVLPSIGEAGQHQLLGAAALVVGVGGLGCAASAYLAGAGIGRIHVADRDRVDVSNLQRQLLYRQMDLGRRKSAVAAEALRAINPDIEITAHEGRLEPERLAALLDSVDIVLDCSDNFRTRLDLNAACVQHRRALVTGAAIRTDGQVLLTDTRRPDSPCYACAFGAEAGADDRCEDAGVLGPLVGLVGSLQALLAIQCLLGQADATGVLQTVDARQHHWRRIEIPRDPECVICAERDDRP